MSITRCTISNNLATGGFITPETQMGPDGGGILNAGSLIMTSSTISGNSCSFDSVGIYAGFASGGGVRNIGSMTITNSTISGNSVGSFDGGVFNRGGISNSGTLQITSSTIAHNSVPGGTLLGGGGGIYGSGATRTDSSVIALNSAWTGPDFTGGGELQSIGYNIIGNNADGVINSQPTDQIGNPAAPIDPLLGPLVDNGGQL